MTIGIFEHLLTEEHIMIRDAARDFAQNEILQIRFPAAIGRCSHWP